MMKYIIIAIVAMVSLSACAAKKQCSPCGKTTVSVVKK
jgi:hypothetical protein